MADGSFLRQNYEYLSAGLSVLPSLAELDGARGRVIVRPARNGEPTMAVPGESGEVALHSAYNPGEEGRRLAQAWGVTDEDLLVFLGTGLGYHIESLLPRIEPDAALVVIEREPGILASMLDRRDWRPLLQRFDHALFVAPEPALIGSMLDRLPFLTRPRRVATWAHGPSCALDKAYYENVEGAILMFLRDNLRNIQTLLTNASTFFENVLRNADLYAARDGVKELFGLFSGKPILLVSAGPSLDLNGHMLRRVGERALIIAADTALKPLLAIGVEPHLVIASDPMPANVRHLAGLPPLEKSVLVGEPSLQRAIFEGYPGPIRIYNFDEAPQRLLAAMLGERGVLSAWGSVSTCALDLAIKLGGDPIVFVGQDLAYTGGRPYCRDTDRENEFLNAAVHWAHPQDYWNSWLAGTGTVEAVGIDGSPVRTTPAMQGYAAYVERQMRLHSDRRFINATEGGILGGPAVPMPLPEALAAALGEPLDLSILMPSGRRSRSNPAAVQAAIRERFDASARFLCEAILELDRTRESPMSVATNRLEALDRDLKQRDRAIYDVFDLLERPAVWAFERAVRKLQHSQRDSEWLARAVDAYRVFYEALRQRAADVASSLPSAEA